MSALLILFLALPQASPGDSARRVVRHALAAVEGDSVQAPRTRWDHLARDAGNNRAATLGLATLDRFTYRYASSDSLFARLETTSPADEWNAAAFLGHAWSLRARGLVGRAGELASLARAASLATGDAESATEALILFASTQSRAAGPRAADSLLQIAERFAGTDRLKAQVHCARAEMLALSFRPAMEEARAGAELAARAGDNRLHASCMHLAAADRIRSSRLAEGAAAFDTVVAERRRLRDDGGLASSLQWRGTILRLAGWLDDAWRDLHESIALGRKSGNASAAAWSFSNLQALEAALGDAPAAATFADSAIRLFRDQGDRYGNALARESQASVAFAAGDLEGAREIFQEVADGYHALGFGQGEQSARLALFHLALKTGNLDEAQRQMDAAWQLTGDLNLAGFRSGLRYHRAVLAMRRGRLADAERDLAQLLVDVQSSAGFVQRDWEYLAALRLAEIRVRRGDLARAEQLALSAAATLDIWRASLTRQDLRVRAFQASEDRSDPDLGLATVVAALARSGRIEGAFALAERLHARDLLDRLARADGLADRDSGSSTGVSTIGTVAPLTDIMTALPDSHAVLLEYVTGQGGEPTTVFAVSRIGVRAAVLAPVDSLAGDIDRLDALLESGSAARELARTLGSRIADPALALLPEGTTHILLVPDGALHRVPFDALVTSRNRFLIEDFTLVTLPSASIVVHLKKQSPRSASPRMLVVGNPARSNSDAGGTPSSALNAAVLALPRLAGSEREAREVARYSAAPTVLLGRQATEARVKQLPLEEYAVLHFATHARADEATLTGTALILAAGEGEDGFLGPGDLMRLHLNADLVVLSACRTGGGLVVRGEGIGGLAGPLIGAGARAVALTRWVIGDRATTDFVEAFYAALASGRPAADALRDAKLALMARGAPAAQWAAFTIVGDGAAHVSLVPRRMDPRYAWWGAGVLALLVALVAGWWRGRRV